MLWCKTCGVRLARLELVPAIRVTREFPVIEATSVLAVDGSRHLKLETTMSADPDSCLPTPVKNFVFDLHDTSFRSQILSEQAALYNGTFRDLSSKYFEKSAWPSAEAIAGECDNDALFLALYKELTHRHYLGYSKTNFKDHVNGWNIYCSLFDQVIAMADDVTDSSSPPGGWVLLPEWAFDIMNEFVYEFQGFCQFRTTQAAQTVLPVTSTGEVAPIVENSILDQLSKHKTVWAVEQVFQYLHRLCSYVHSTAPTVTRAHRTLGIFASVALSRLECLLGDYHASLAALSPLYWTTTSPTDTSVLEEVNSVFLAKLSLAYHAGISYLMLRRYKDAIRVVSDMCMQLANRGFTTGSTTKKAPGTEQYIKFYDRMIALLAILNHITPAARLEDVILKAIRDNHANQLSKIEAGEEGYEDLFLFAAPKFIHPAVPNYGQPQPTTLAQDVSKLQLKQFMSEMNQQHVFRKLRSYMKLYTSIPIAKLATFNDIDQDEIISYLISFKHKMRQLESNPLDEDDGSGVDDEAAEDVAAIVDGSLLDGKVGSALDIHYYLVGDVVHVDEAEKQRRFEAYFLSQIGQCEEILKALEIMPTTV